MDGWTSQHLDTGHGYGIGPQLGVARTDPRLHISGGAPTWWVQQLSNLTSVQAIDDWIHRFNATQIPLNLIPCKRMVYHPVFH